MDSQEKYNCITGWIIPYILLSTDTVSLYHNTSAWQDPGDASSWNRLYISRSSYSRAIVILSVSDEIVTYNFQQIRYRQSIMLNSWELLNFSEGGSRQISPRKWSTLGGREHIYIVMHWQTVSLYHNPSEWLDQRDTSRWDRLYVSRTSKLRAFFILRVSDGNFYVG